MGHWEGVLCQTALSAGQRLEVLVAARLHRELCRKLQRKAMQLVQVRVWHGCGRLCAHWHWASLQEDARGVLPTDEVRVEWWWPHARVCRSVCQHLSSPPPSPQRAPCSSWRCCRLWIACVPGSRTPTSCEYTCAPACSCQPFCPLTHVAPPAATSPCRRLHLLVFGRLLAPYQAACCTVHAWPHLPDAVALASALNQ